ncbi:conserved protein of unknown function [Sulfobacillus acidophilus TPY]|uniref:DUF3501 domain-containing protein n=1 Tax=Sulfobacillus acidophilus (strain ATCC 700253 / DSM 10332 / NAL) TaxID=679936 RepID=G8TXW0_SULAD|nr:conserved protein of unknown function [Sulfobacillus acidophilus TPY]AEW06166.1 hypothetical protein Sulac_2704 [Sulfobacillus acidophilus DSM 10332]
MKPLTLSDIMDIRDYERARDHIRRQVIALKKVRRVGIGPRVSVVFENRETMKFQIQEMCRIEHIVDPALVQQEIDVYNDLLPEGLAIGATLLIELVQQDDMPAILKELSGLEETVWLTFGDQKVHAEAELGRSTEEKTSTVHYLTFRFTPAQRQALAETDRAELVTTHPAYSYRTPLAPTTVASLVADLLES